MSEYGLQPRPEVNPEVLAVVVAAVDQAWPRPPVTVVPETGRPAVWRFSGRWWARPAAARRDRPWAR